MIKYKVLCLITAFMCLFSFQITSFADFPNGTIRCYTISTGNNTIAYNSASTGSGQKGTIYDSDELYVTQINNGWVNCSYPVSGGRKDAWIPLSVITENNLEHSSYTAPQKITTYKRQGSGEYGYVSKGDNVIVVASGSGNWRQVIYPIASGYKLAWVDYNYASSESTSQSAESAKLTNAPSVSTVSAIQIGGERNPAIYAKGTIDKNFGCAITELGIIYGTSNPPKTKKACLRQTNSGNFEIIADSLKLNTTYYYQMYAVSEMGIGYGEVKSIQLISTPEPEDDHSSTKQNITNRQYTPVSDTEHSIDITYDMTCTKCSKIVESGNHRTETEEHSFDFSGTCSKCEYKKASENLIDDSQPKNDTSKADGDAGQIIDTTMPPENENVKINSITLSESSVKLDVDDYIVLDYTVSPNGADISAIKWSTNADDVAQVTQSGKITAVGAGTATITMCDAITGKKATCTVKVTENIIEPSSVRLSKSSLKMKIDDTTTLKAIVSPSNAQNKQVIWSSSKEYIASVDLKGKITAKQAGTAIITVQTEVGGETDTCSVTVTASDPITRVPESEKIFNDVPLDHWANVYIAEMKRQKIIDGYPDGNFYPEQIVTRAEFAKMLVLAAGRTASKKATSSFADINATDWCSPYVETVSNYLTGYYENGQYIFQPETVARREDMAVAVVKLKGFDNEEYDLAELETIFTDYDTISDGLRRYVSIAIRNDIMHGYPDATFRAQDTLTRAEAATLLYNAFTKIGYGKKTTY